MRARVPGFCMVEGCGRQAQVTGFCQLHYDRWRRFGDPLYVRPVKPPRERLPRPVKLCTITGCERRAIARGFCDKHYARWRAHGDPLHVAKRGRPLPTALCAVEGCERQAVTRGFCKPHYERWRLHGHPLRERETRPRTGQDRLRAWLAEHPNPCLTYNLQEIGDEFGMTRERVRQLILKVTGQPWGRRGGEARRAKTDRLLADFLEAHPEAMLIADLRGMSLREIGEAIGIAESQVQQSWKRLGLPPRSLQTLTPGERAARRTETLYLETCVSCGAEFPWTPQKERNRRAKGTRVVCSTGCGIRQAIREGQKWGRHSEGKEKWGARILRMETCITCGVEFPWTNRRERDRKAQGCRIVCSRGCGQRAAHQEKLERGEP